MGSMFKKSKQRSLLIGLVWMGCFIMVIGRLFWLQAVDYNELLAAAKETWIKEDVLRPKRGTIYDRTKQQQLAWEVDAYYFVADTRQVKNPQKTANLLAPILKIDADVLAKKLSKKSDSVELRHAGKYKYPEEVLKKVTALDEKGLIDGIYAFPTFMRQYNGTLAAHVLGFLRYDDTAVGGLEQYYDKWLRGKEGYVKYLKARNGMMVSDQPEKNRPPEPSKDLVLTIDSRMQHQLELELEEAIDNYQAKGGTAIVADPKTGEILAMASRPTFDPGNYSETLTEDNARNQAVQSQFEPGSTFKIVTLAAAIEEGVFQPDATFRSGSVKAGDRVIHDWNGSGWGQITFRDGIKLSSNVAFVLLGQKLGEQKLIDYINRFGFGDISQQLGKKTGIDLPAEGRGYFFGRNLYSSELATVSFGQGISVTPIQQVASLCAIANGGTWHKPHILDSVWETGLEKKVQPYKPESRRIIKESTAKQVRELLREVVRNGTGVEAELPGYGVAGKTGTAQKPNPDGSGYLENKYIVSFTGFAPYNNPEIVVYVAIDEPSSAAGNASGGTVAAPVAREILKKSLQIRHIEPNDEFAQSIK